MKLFGLFIFCTLVLTGCSFRGFQPPPYTWENFYKIKYKDTDFNIIKNDMLECGFTDIFKSLDMTNKEYVKSQVCMSKKGYKNSAYKDGICQNSYFREYCLYKPQTNENNINGNKKENN